MPKQSKTKQDLERLKHRPPPYWKKRGERMALDLFKYAFERVPAYKDFLAKAGFGKGSVESIKDFRRVPFVTKDSYLKGHEYLDLFPDRDISEATTISATSGSTGEPIFFPRGEENDKQYERVAERFLVNQFEIDHKKTLGIIGFALGVWIGGIFTYKTFNEIAKKGYKFTLIPIGTNKDLFLKSFKKFAPLYEQIILMGYPPFIKDVLDSAEEYGIVWQNYNLKILTAAEGYSEKFRNYIAEQAGIKNTLTDIINIYGTVEQGTLATETSFANLIRRMATEDKKVFRALFPDATNVPTLAQYDPGEVYFETDEGEVVATCYGSSIPLIRYKFSDLGGVIPFDEMIERFDRLGIDILKEAQKSGIDKQIFTLPFVYIYARSDFAVTLYGILIRPEYIRECVGETHLDKILTGRFTIKSIFNRRQDQFLEVNFELKKGQKGSRLLGKKISTLLVECLTKHSTEYRHLFSSPGYQKRLGPKIKFWPHLHQKYFSRTGKQRWVE